MFAMKSSVSNDTRTAEKLNKTEPKNPDSTRSGTILVLLAVLLPVLFAMVAFAIDLGMMMLVKAELQRSAEAAALAAVSDIQPGVKPPFPLKSPVGVNLGVSDDLLVYLNHDLSTGVELGGHEIKLIDPQKVPYTGDPIGTAKEYAKANSVMGAKEFELLENDIRVFRVPDKTDSLPLLPLPLGLTKVTSLVEDLLLRAPDHNCPNAVTVVTRRDETANGAMNFLFGPVMGQNSTSITSKATAVRMPGYGIRPGARILPFAMDITVWKAIRLGNGVVNGVPLVHQILGTEGRPIILIDEQRWDGEKHQVHKGSDGIWEVLLLNAPLQDVNLTKSLLPGLSLESRVKKTPATIVSLNFREGEGVPTRWDLTRQIHKGVTHEDIGPRLYLPFKRTGDESIPSEVFRELDMIIGEPRIIPLFETVGGTVVNKVKGLLGKQETYKIVGFAGVVITEAKDLGIAKYLKIQPAPVTSQFVLKAGPDQLAAYTDSVYTCPLLVE